MDEEGRITAFWQWWSQHEQGLAALLDADPGQPGRRALDAQLGEQLNELDPSLNYRIDPGVGRSQRTLTITAHGQGLLLALARRVRAAAPPPSRRWSYSNFVLPVADLSETTLTVAHRELRLADTRVELGDAARKVNATVWHPEFAHFPHAEERYALACSIMESTLGEESFLCWINELTAPEVQPPQWSGLHDLRELVNDVRARFLVGLPGMNHWAQLEGTRYDGAHVHARVTVPLCPARAPLLEKVVTIRLHLEDPAGSPHADGLEERIVQAIGFDGELVAVETVGDVRTWYCYVLPESGAVQRLMALAREEELPAEAAKDPTWQVVSHLS
ncbi:MAG: hypothetical protein Q4G35_12345 [Propionibacteriaceae bacterium]|nr:hypothetical protein [Propionibacteriaceae bacterium]